MVRQLEKMCHRILSGEHHSGQGRIYCASGHSPALKFKPRVTSDKIILDGIYIDMIEQDRSLRSPAISWNDIGLQWAKMAI
jgi:hypothetical protein